MNFSLGECYSPKPPDKGKLRFPRDVFNLYIQEADILINLVLPFHEERLFMELESQFAEAQVQAKTLPKQGDNTLLELYSLYKQAINGDVSGKPPGMFDIVAKAKYEAWKKRKGMSKEKAIQDYIDLVAKLKAKK